MSQLFAKGWPEEAAEVVTGDVLDSYLREIHQKLAGVIERLHKRLRWALDQMARLDQVRAHKGTLDPAEDSLRSRCDRLVKRLKGLSSRQRQEAEGYDDTNTYGVLAAEGFLPGYGLDTGWVLGYFHAPVGVSGQRDWELRRNLALALREYVPGNMIYANGHRYIPRFFHLGADEPTLFQVDVANEAVAEVGAEGCPSECASSCIDCLQNFRNAYYHRHLNRHSAGQRLAAWGDQLLFSNDIPPRLPAEEPQEQPVNEAEEQLRRLLERAGFHGAKPQYPIDLGKPLGTTTPDFYFELEDEEGLCIYLDGLSAHLHGNPATRLRDRQIREELRSRFYEAFEIPYSDLSDRAAMKRHLFRIGRVLLGKEKARELRDDTSWIED